MLVLSRRIRERILCRLPSGETMTITVVDIDRERIRIGFDCPRSVVIAREEVREMLEVKSVDD